MRNSYTVLTITYLRQPALGKRPRRTWLAGAALLTARQRFRKWDLDVRACAAMAGDRVTEVPLWLAKNLGSPTTLVGWKLDQDVVPALIDISDTCGDPAIAQQLLEQLDCALTGQPVDLARGHRGDSAKPLHLVANSMGVAMPVMTRPELDEAWRAGRVGVMEAFSTARAQAMWQMFAAKPKLATHDFRHAAVSWLKSDDYLAPPEGGDPK